MLTERHAKKDALVHNILANGTYLPESGLYRMLYQRLMKLSLCDLSGLGVIIRCKITSAQEGGGA